MGILEKITDALGLVYFGRDKAVEKKEPSNHALEDMIAWNRMLEKGGHERVEAGMSEQDGARYEKLEKEHFGDYDKKTGIYAPKAQHSQSVTPEQAKTLLQSDAHHALSLNPRERKEHYKNVQEKQGQKALEKLLAEVRKQRTKSNALEM